MANMSYCRFQNTSSDLRDCLDYFDDQLSESEQRARKRLIRQCAEVLQSLGVTVDEDELKGVLEVADSFQ